MNHVFHRQTHMKLFPILFALLASWSGAAHAETSDGNLVYWYGNHWPPARIMSGPDQGRGWADHRVKTIAERLPTFRHETVTSSPERRQEDMKIKPNICHPALLKTPDRETYIEFSEVFSWILSNGIITTRNRYPQFKAYLNEDGELRLAEMLGAGKYRIAITPGRRYGGAIDEAVRKYSNQPMVVADVRVSTPGPDSVLLKLADQDEYDMVPGYAVELTYMAREAGLNEEDFVFLPVTGQPPLVPTYIGCSKSDFGRKVVTEINKLFADKQIREKEAAAYRAWLGEGAAKYYDRVLARKLSVRGMKP